MLIKNIIKHMLDLPNTILFNFKVFPIPIAILLPVRVNRNVKVGKMQKGSVKIDAPHIKKGMVQLGYHGAGFISPCKSSINVRNSGKIVFSDGCVLAEGFNIHCDNGELIFKTDFFSNRNLTIQCEKKIIFGENNLIGWNVCIRDTDGHVISDSRGIKPKTDEIVFGNHVWIAADCTILKGTEVASDTVIGCNSLVCGLKARDPNTLIIGSPATIKRRDIVWKK